MLGMNWNANFDLKDKKFEKDDSIIQTLLTKLIKLVASEVSNSKYNKLIIAKYSWTTSIGVAHLIGFSENVNSSPFKKNTYTIFHKK